MSNIPNVIEQTNRGERSLDIISQLLSNRIIILEDSIDRSTANTIIAELLFLEAQNPDKDIQIYINSQSGSLSAAFAIYDTMQYVSSAVSTICIGCAASFGAFLLASGARGKRFALHNAEIMIQQPSINGDGLQGSVSDVKIASDYLQRSKRKLNRILAQNTGHTVDEVEKDTDRDYFMSAETALKYGLIDGIIDSDWRKSKLNGKTM